jgi:hypothetical protein
MMVRQPYKFPLCSCGMVILLNFQMVEGNAAIQCGGGLLVVGDGGSLNDLSCWLCKHTNV